MLHKSEVEAPCGQAQGLLMCYSFQCQCDFKRFCSDMPSWAHKGTTECHSKALRVVIPVITFAEVLMCCTQSQSDLRIKIYNTKGSLSQTHLLGELSLSLPDTLCASKARMSRQRHREGLLAVPKRWALSFLSRGFPSSVFRLTSHHCHGQATEN